jgi:hypothetical protein
VQQTITGKQLLRFLQGHSEEELKQRVDCSPDQYGDGYVIWLGAAGLSVSENVDDIAEGVKERGRVLLEFEND